MPPDAETRNPRADGLIELMELLAFPAVCLVLAALMLWAVLS